MENFLSKIDLDTLSRILKNIPSCIFFKDTELKYVFSTHYWEHINTGEDAENFDIYGKTDLEIRKDKENALKAYESDKEILRTGKGCKYIIKSNINGEEGYCELIKEPVRDKDGNIIGIVGLINDVTEKIILHNELQKLSSIDSLTNLYNRYAGTGLIGDSIADSVDNKYFCLMDIDNFKRINDKYGHISGDKVLIGLSEILSNISKDKGIAMRLGGDEFVLFIELDDIDTFINELFHDVDNIELQCIENNHISISVGMVKVKQGDDFESLYHKADLLMYKAKENKGNNLLLG